MKKVAVDDNSMSKKRTTLGPGWKDIMLFYSFDFASILEYYNLTYTVSNGHINVSSPTHTIQFNSFGSLTRVWQTNPEKKQKWYIHLQGYTTSVGALNTKKEQRMPWFTWNCVYDGISKTCTKYTTTKIQVERKATSFAGALNEYNMFVGGKPIDVANASDDQITEYLDVRKKMNKASDCWETLRTLNKGDIVDFKNQNECIGYIYIICENMKKVKNN